jgi:hypothetical protein
MPAVINIGNPDLEYSGKGKMLRCINPDSGQGEIILQLKIAGSGE